MNAPAVIAQQSAFGINELTTQLVLRLVKDDELLACGCVSKVLERAVDDAREGNILRARRHRRAKSPWHVDLANGDDAADGTRRRPLRSDTEAIHLFINHVLHGVEPFGEVVVHCASCCGHLMRACAADGCGDAVCPIHGSGVGEILATDAIPLPHLKFEPSRCRHMGCQNVDVTYASAISIPLVWGAIRIYTMISAHIAPPTGRAVAARDGDTTPGGSRA